MNLILKRFLAFNNILDKRFEDLWQGNRLSIIYRDLSAGLIVALTAIPMAMGFAMAMGLRPEQGIVAGALACLVGRTWGGSKYQVYGPTAAFIPVIAGLMAKYGHPATGGDFTQAHGMLVACSVVSGIILLFMGLAGMGKYVKLVPNSIVVGFTVGIAVVIALSNVGEILGLQAAVRGDVFEKLKTICAHLNEFNVFAFILAGITFGLTKFLLKKSVFIPAPLIALVLCTVLAETVFDGRGVADIAQRYGSIPANFFSFTGPSLPPLSTELFMDFAYFVVAIVFVSSVESLLCSSMADRLAENKKTPFDPDKELWGQGMVQALVPLVNGFPCTGALARTATSIKAGAVTPLAGYFKGILKIVLAICIAPWLEMVPMACIGGILVWVAGNMVKVHEVKEVWKSSRFHAFLMTYTAVMVPLTDFLTGVLSALIIYGLSRVFAKSDGESAAKAGKLLQQLEFSIPKERKAELVLVEHESAGSGLSSALNSDR